MQAHPSRLQIATKIHFFLLRELGQGIEVEKMLNQPLYARDVLLVCDACPGTELVRLAALFRESQPPAAGGGPGAPAGQAPAPLEIARDHSGFGISRLVAEPGPARRRSWLTLWRDR